MLGIVWQFIKLKISLIFKSIISILFMEYFRDISHNEILLTLIMFSGLINIS